MERGESLSGRFYEEDKHLHTRVLPDRGNKESDVLTVGLHRFLATANGARVVSLSSSANMIAPVVFDYLHFNFLRYEPFVAYGQSKTANVLFAVEASAAGWMTESL
jgi:hypothetical protein